KTLLHSRLYDIAFVEGDTAAMKRQIDWASGNPEEYEALGWQARTRAFSGQLRQAREFFARAADMAERHDMKGRAAEFAADHALTEAAFGNCQQAREVANGIRKVQRGEWFDLSEAALALALCGEVAQAQAIADELAKQYTRATLLHMFYLPQVWSAIEIQ